MNLVSRIIRKLLHRTQIALDHVQVEQDVTLNNCELIGPIDVGFRSYANNTLIRNASIGRFCSIGRRCSIGAANHSTIGISTHSSLAPKDFVSDPRTIIGNDVWIGDNVIILAGVVIGDGAVIGGGSIVRDNVPAYEIFAGVPAKHIRRRFDPATIMKLCSIEWWRYDGAFESFTERHDIESAISYFEQNPRSELLPHFKAFIPLQDEN